MEKMENDMIAKRVYVGECAGSRSVGRQARRVVHNRSEWCGFVRVNA